MRLFTDVAARISDPFLSRAYTLAESGRGTTSPNPMVGCVVVSDGVVVGEGFHQHAGGPHAEIVALTAAGHTAWGSTAYVTLEPCDHFGRTPPCTSALLEAGVARVVIGMADPSVAAAGGASTLREAGVEVCFAQDSAPFVLQNEAWLHHLRVGRPYVHVKLALSLDAHPTSALGLRTQVSGLGGAEVTMRLRSAADVVVVGSSTARIDDPALTVRDPQFGAPVSRQPLRVVFARKDVPDASLFHDGLGESRALVPDVVSVPDGVSALRYHATGNSSADLCAAFVALGETGARRVLVEAGPKLFSALWEARLIDELTLVHAGGVFGADALALYGGGEESAGAVSAPVDRLDVRMRAVEAGVIMDDAVTVWVPLETQDVNGRQEADRE
ncbi:MAG: bifunctional diaminohydroxyphosphoribosylaminopyrimidine deaminase/5-amino-6-(5-phosphoribosylamino)uracil reductase RibD [Coriobacteriia bacterium]|nr:bifunctional diaminohydroxyphosphoribosylaminopyrimidine deaminase/5-amino-6-(5-phosphoribosylamino)uracil reductase RibD [Coriobacteriia bacterium]